MNRRTLGGWSVLGGLLGFALFIGSQNDHSLCNSGVGHVVQGVSQTASLDCSKVNATYYGGIVLLVIGIVGLLIAIAAATFATSPRSSGATEPDIPASPRAWWRPKASVGLPVLALVILTIVLGFA